MDGTDQTEDEKSKTTVTEEAAPEQNVTAELESTTNEPSDKDIVSLEKPPLESPQKSKGKKKGKKKQKWKVLDISALPDPTPSQNARKDTRQDMSHSSSTWGGLQTSSQHQGNVPASHMHEPPSRWSSQSSHSAYNSQRQAFMERVADVPRARGDLVALSKALVRLLRHGNPDNIYVDDEGYASIEEIVAHNVFKNFHTSVREIENLVNTNDKKRFEIVYDGNRQPQKIRATQGHSIKVKSLGLELINNPHKHPTVVHGTYLQNWKKIKNEGLRRFQRTHVHFAIGLIGETHVTSGMRASCDVIIYLDMEKAMKDGIKFYESSNNVVLSEGDARGVISPKYFKKVTKYNYNKGQFEPLIFGHAD